MNRQPGIIQRAKLALQVYRQGLPMRKSSPLMWPDFRVGTPQWHLVNLDAFIREGFEFNSLIYSAIMYKAKAMSSVPLRAYTGTVDEPELLPEDQPLAKLVARPNPSQSWREFQMMQTVWLNLTGNAFAYIDRQGSIDGTPTALYPLNPLRTYIIPGTKGTIKGYVYCPENVSLMDGIPLLADDVSHVKLPNPSDPLDGQGYGMSPLQALGKSADVDNAITNFLKIFFDRGTQIGGVLKFSVPLGDPEVARIRTRWKEIYGGSNNWDEIGILDQTGEYQRVGYSFDEMGFGELDERNETRILGPFGVHPILIGSRTGLANSTYSNIEQAYRQFWQDTLLHEARLFEDDYQYYLTFDNAFVAFDFSDVPAFSQDISMAVDSWVKLVGLGVPKNNAAEVVGLSLGDLPDGDVAYMPLNLVPINEATAAREAQAEARPQTEPDSEPVGVDEEERDELALRLFGVEVKKNSHPHNGRHSGRQASALIGAGKAASRMAQNERLRRISENSSQDSQR